MTVAELITILKERPPEATVLLQDWSEGYAPPGECAHVSEKMKCGPYGGSFKSCPVHKVAVVLGTDEDVYGGR